MMNNDIIWLKVATLDLKKKNNKKKTQRPQFWAKMAKFYHMQLKGD